MEQAQMTGSVLIADGAVLYAAKEWSCEPNEERTHEDAIDAGLAAA